jgi:hypothetical protein
VKGSDVVSEDEFAAPSSSLILYQTGDGQTRVQCRFEDETIWLTQALMAELFQTTPQNITLHLKALYEEGELSEAATCKEYLQVRREGARDVSRQLRHYNLPAIVAVGFRVRSKRGTQFRQWATALLSEYLVKGFVMDDERRRNPGPDVPDYFDEMLARIRDIRASERRMYLRVRDILAMAADYAPSEAETQVVFQIMQNKLHFADGADGTRAHCKQSGCHAAEHGAHGVEGRSRAQKRRGSGQELPEGTGDRRAHSHRGDVPRFCRGSGAATETDLSQDMEREAR